MTDLPSGTVTFLFSDIEGSTRLWEEHPDAMRECLARHDEIMRDAIDAHDGHVVKTTGDGFHAAFATAHDALQAAGGAQRALTDEHWSDVGELRVRMGVHTGEAGQRDGDYYAPALNRAARLMSAAHGGQIVCSQTTADLVLDEIPTGLELRDLGVHQLRDLERPERVFQVCAVSGEREFPPLRSLDIYPGNLPSHLSSFVGRERDLAQLRGDLQRHQIVTLTGVGGVGKTRLAVQLCADSLPRFRDGAWFVDLAPVRDGAQVASTVAKVMGVNEHLGEDLTVTLRDALRERDALVLLDNGEHLIDDVSALLIALTSRLVAARFLVTSREPLGIDGEQVRRVASLDGATASALFVQRASSVRPDINWDSYEHEIEAICEQLDGIPLAVELAAARTRSMLPPDILRRLDERFRLLQGSSRSARERHQTLLAAVDWSYDLLTAEEQACFDRLAIFRGGFDLEAAEAVCVGGLVDELDVVDLLERLVDKSMVLTIEHGHRSTYRLLETLRQFAESKLAASGGSEEYRHRHVDYFMGVAAEWGARAVTSEQRAANTRLAFDRSNLNAMLDRLFADEQWDRVVAVCRSLGNWWSSTSPEDGRRWIVAVEPHLDELPREQRIDFLGFGSFVLASASNTVDACRLAYRAVDEAGAAGIDPPPEAYFGLTWHMTSNGRAEEAYELARVGVALAEQKHMLTTGLLIRAVGLGALIELDPVAAVRETADYAVLTAQLGIPTFIAGALYDQGLALAQVGDRAAAEQYFDQALEQARDIVLQIEIAVMLQQGLLATSEDPERALGWLHNAIDGAERYAVNPDMLLDSYEGVADIWLAEGRIRETMVLIGGVDQLREIIEVSGERKGAPRRERVHRGLREQLSEQEVQVLSARGRALTRDEMRRFVLGELDALDG
jgi:predicted ATPase/class 3 adenylate cyclase